MKSSRGSNKSSKSSNFLIQGSILAIAGIVVRIIGLAYRVPMSSKIGETGDGYYGAAFGIYNIMLIMSSYSLPSAVSKMIAVRIGQKKYKSAHRILKLSLIYATIVGAIGALILWFGAQSLANMLNMPYSAYAIKTLSPTIWVLSYLGVIRGYFQGNGTMVPTAVSQVFEQIVNAVVSLMAADYLFSFGEKVDLANQVEEYKYAYSAAGGTIGTGAGALTALLIVLTIYVLYRPTQKRKLLRDESRKIESYRYITYTLCLTIVPMIISSTVYHISTIIDNFMFGNAMGKLTELGDKEVAALWGVYSSRYHTLFNIPVAISNALASSLLPSLARTLAEKKRKPIIEKINMVIRFSMLIAIPSAVGLAVMAEPISNLLYPNADNTTLVKLLICGSFAVVVFSLSTVTNAVLQGINKMHVPILNAAISLVVHIVLTVLFLYVGKWGIYGVVVGNILFALLICILNQLSIRRYLRYRQEWRKTFLIPVLSSVLMGGAAYGTYELIRLITAGLSFRISNLLAALTGIVVAMAVYLIALIKMRGISERELSGIPGGVKIILLARKFHLL